MCKPAEIRGYRPEDREGVVGITLRCFSAPSSIDYRIEERFGSFGDMNWKFRKRRQVEQELDADPEGVFIAEQGGAAVGYITTGSDPDAGVGTIPNLAVLPEQRGQGIARALIKTALEHFRRRGLQLARIETLDSNQAGQYLYPSLGFREVARQIHYAMPLREPGPERKKRD